MRCKVKIENLLVSNSMNNFIGRNIGELCKSSGGKKLSTNDYMAIANLREKIRLNKEEVLDSLESKHLKDAIKLMPLYMSAYLLYISNGDVL